jgi:hypothetical protein
MSSLHPCRASLGEGPAEAPLAGTNYAGKLRLLCMHLHAVTCDCDLFAAMRVVLAACLLVTRTDTRRQTLGTRDASYEGTTASCADCRFLEASPSNKPGSIMLKDFRLRLLKFAPPSLILAAWLAVASKLVDDGAACKSEGLSSVHGNTLLASFHQHPALISLLDLPNSQPAGR